ncbi:MAG: hypothetical protein A2283_18000 [Lentisphaerae bacterium RIFOXYA12_FULL_48_11]|nr:MAG: hypothetical protein A2283_18000 [Lentisphaerae bacterium RIFOXYA12_FULL_48_11]
MIQSKTIRWSLLSVIILAVILTPFFIFGPEIEAWTNTFIQAAARHSFVSAAVIFTLLSSDILLPVPSSLVSTGAGLILGLPLGFIASWLGMTTACLIGYWLGASSRKQLSRKLLGADEIKRLENMNQRFGDWLIVTARAVPVLAEASVLFAGIGAMPFHRFILMSIMSNAAISLVYTATGVFSASRNSFLLAFCGAILIPAIGMMLFQNKKKETAR